MFFLIRTGFWFSIVLLALPLGSGDDGNVGPLQALAAAREAVGDVAGLCDRKPEVCVTGRAAFQTIGNRARAATDIAYKMMDDKAMMDDTAARTDRSISTGAVTPAKARPAGAGKPAFTGKVEVPTPRPTPASAD